MMLIVISNALLLGIQWFCDRWRQSHYAAILSTAMNRMSLLIQRCQPLRLPRNEAAGVFKLSLASKENDTQMTTAPSQFVMKDNYLIMHEMKSWATVDLSSWVTYRYPIRPKVDLEASKFCVLLEAVLRDEIEPQSESTNPVHDLSCHILTFGTPIAWRSDNSYAVIMSCDNMDSLVRMVDAFGQQRLIVSDALEVTSIGTVQTTGSPKALSASQEIFSPAKEEVEEAISFDTETSLQSEAQSFDSVDASKIQKSNAEVKSETLRLSIETPLTSKSSNSSNVSTNSSHQKTFISPATSDNKHFSSADMSSDSKVFSSGQKTFSKPPNILIYCGVKDTKRKYEEACESIKGCVNTDSYTIYHLKQEHIFTTPWQDNTAVLVISACPRLQPDVEKKVSEFIFNYGGNLLSFGSSADKLFRDHYDLVKNDDEEEITNFEFEDWKSVSSSCGQFTYLNCRRGAKVVIPVRSKNASLNNAAIVVKVNCENGGLVILSQLLLEQDPVSQAKDKASFDLLKKSNNSRLAVLRELLALTGLDTQHATPPALTPCYLIAQKKGLKESFLASFKSRLQNGILKSKNMCLSFQMDQNQTPTEPQTNLLPILIDEDVDKKSFEYFDMSEYWRHLKTSSLGQIAMYTDVITSTMPVFDGLLFSIPEDMSPIAIAGRQVQGKGRAGNTWLSPSGCAMFTFPLAFSLHSNLGQRISFLQHMVSMAVIRGVLNQPGYQDLDLRLKWPNDIYYGKELKLGGVLVISSVMGHSLFATIGCGVNVSNSDPTICINDIIQHRNASNPDLPPLASLTTGQVIARTLTVLEELMNDFETKGYKHISELYCQHWLHGGCKVKVDLETQSEGEIVGLDGYGFLLIKTNDGKLMSVQPDGNSFDMMHNLIHFKTK